MRNSELTTTSRINNRCLLVLASAIAVGIVLAIALVQLAEYQYFETLERQGNERLELYASTVQSAKQRFDYLPFIATRDQDVINLLKGENQASQVNHKLASWQLESGAAALYLMNREGSVLASSNWASQESFVGKNYHFRPYFKDAIAGREGQFFAVGASTGRPGLFLSRPIEVGQQTIGVAVIKIDMKQLEIDWASGGELVLVTDSDGVIFLSSQEAWKYKSITPVPQAILKRFVTEKKYGNNRVSPLNVLTQKRSPQGHKMLELSSPGSSHARPENYLMHKRLLPELNWTLYYLTDLKGLVEKRRYALLISGLITILLALIGFIVVNQIRSRHTLESRVAKRTKALNETNRRLLEEIDSRKVAEERLHQTHEELIQAEKLAALGQMSAGIVHEINQPLSAMQTFIASTRILFERNDKQGATENLEDIASMIRRVTKIVGHLKGFAGKSKGQTTAVDVFKVIDNALLLLGPRLNKPGLTLNIKKPNHPIYVTADEIKLEQIIINLIRNGLDAMQELPVTEVHKLSVWVEVDFDKTHILVSDTGNGITPENLPKVFDPFFTTKAIGDGLGLGLSVSYGIAKEFGGDLAVIDQAGPGTLFKLSLNHKDRVSNGQQ